MIVVNIIFSSDTKGIKINNTFKWKKNILGLLREETYLLKIYTPIRDHKNIYTPSKDTNMICFWYQ